MKEFVEGKAITNAHPMIRMFALCEAMKWNHLPLAGGLYEQDPELLDGFMYIFGERAAYEEEQERKRKAEDRRKNAQGAAVRR